MVRNGIPACFKLLPVKAALIIVCAFILHPGNGWAQTALTRQQAEEDIDFYVRTVKASHYQPFLHITEKAYDNRIAAIKHSMGDSIGIRDFVSLFYQVTALLGDAHSTPVPGQPVFREEFGKEQFFPYRLLANSHQLYVPASLAKDLGIPAGAAITDINGENINTLFRQAEAGIAGLPSFREEAAGRLFSYFLFLRNIRPPFVLGYKNRNGMAGKSAPIAGVTFKKALSASMPHIVQPYTHQILQQKLGYIDIRSLSGDIDQFRAFLDTSFRQFNEAGIQHLAIDLRQNSGGNTDLGDLLFSYISDKKYTWGTKHWKISQPYKDQLKAGGDTTSAYLQKTNGAVWASENSCLPKENPFGNNIRFKGKIYFITGPFTFSSAMAVADVVKTYGLGTIVGQPTGENVKDFGEAFVITLPNSKIRIQSTTSLSTGADCHRKKNGPVQPDVMAGNTLQDDISGRDKTVEYILGTIR